MKILTAYPQNYSEIKAIINPPEDALFPWGDKIYNPSGKEIPPDIQWHEQVHLKQQKNSSPEVWWFKWLNVKEFRQEQELQAFTSQLQFIKRFYPKQAVKEALDEMAENLSNNYKLDINKYEAEALIRRRIKETNIKAYDNRRN